MDKNSSTKDLTLSSNERLYLKKKSLFKYPIIKNFTSSELKFYTFHAGFKKKHNEKLKLLQKNHRYIESFNHRVKKVKYCYFQLIIWLNIFDLLYLLVSSGYIYHYSISLDDTINRIAYSLSFASSTLLVLNLRQIGVKHYWC